MANEITVNLTIRVNKSPFDQTYQFNRSFDQAVVGGGNPGKVTIGTSEEDLNLGDIVTPSLFLFHNMDGTNFVDIGVSATTPTLAKMLRIGPGKFGMGWLFPTATPRAIADTAPVDLMFWVFEA